VYSFTNNNKIGFEYSLHVAAGADVRQIKMQYGGDVKTITKNKQGNLVIESDIEGIQQSTPISYYPNQPINQSTNKLITNYQITNTQVTFTLPNGYDNTKPIIIDPFISSTSNLDGLNAGKAKDIDFDYAGNVYVTGGGDVLINHRLAKYNSTGVLQWTFNGVLTTPSWEFGTNMGGWVVEKPTGKIYLGHGANVNGIRVIRLNSNGVYDNYITNANINFQENWRIIWNCNNGNPEILIAGGGISSNINIASISPPSNLLNNTNLTGIPFTPPFGPNSGGAQDIVDFIIDPLNNDMYTIYASSVGTPILNNKVYKNSSPYSAASTVWNVSSGLTTMSELMNRPYLLPFTFNGNHNSANIFALNGTYLFYWDGKNLKAFNKATGATVGTALITTNTAKMMGGIYADACNNVYVGNVNGTIKVYNFNGTTFNDAPADITITGYATKSVYDLAYNEADKLLYASGDGFVASFDLSGTCATSNTNFIVNIVPNCLTASATANLVPTPPSGSVITYTLFIGTTQIATNTTGIFTSLLPQTNYKIIATINAACSGTQIIGNFLIPSSALPTVTTPIIYCQAATATALTATGTNLLWYTTNTGGTSTTTAPIPSTATIGTTAYYVSQTTAGNCESQRAQINVEVTATSTAPIVTTPIIYCQGATATALTATGTNLLWYTTITGGTGNTTAPIPTTATIGTTAYYVSQTTAGNCESQRAQINVEVTATSTAPIVTTPIIYCQGAAASALTAIGTNLLWYTTNTGGTSTTTAPIPSTTTVGAIAYYVSQTTAGNCESQRATINVQVTAASTAPIVTTPIIYCQGATATALTATGTNLLWYTTITGGTGTTAAPILSTASIGTTAYYVSQTTAGNCESQRAQINVQVIAVTAAPTVTTPIIYCQGATTTALTATGTNLLWYTTNTGGTGTTTAPIPSTATVGTTAYYVSQSTTAGNCESPRAQINVQITAVLTANAGNTVTIAAGTTTQLNATATAGADYTWSSTIAPISLNNIKILNPIASPLQTTTYLLTVRDILGNCTAVTSNVQVVVIGTQNCINIRNAFTPNGDGINDKWLVYDQDFCLAPNGASVQVFNKYGSKVYENNAYKNTWDGTYKNKPLPDGTYYAVIVFTLFDARKQYAKTDVTIVR
jgi:gliding motility-associated-like protein